MTEQVIEIEIDNLASPDLPNYRRNLGKLDELAASIREAGVLEPLVVRPSAVGHEIVFGERRKAAAKLAGLSTVPCIVRHYDDDQVLEARLIENIQRAEVHPIDEAEAFAELVRRGYSASQVAEKIGRSHGYVVQRLRLCELSPKCRAALDAEQITVGVAVLLAALPSQKIQDEALSRVAYDGTFAHDGLLSVKDARDVIESEVMLALKDAPFKTDDAELVPAAGACTNCPKRTGVQTELFADASSPDLCTDPPCFRKKLDALWKLRTKEAKKEGIEVLSQAESKKALQSTMYGSGEYRRLDETEYVGGKSRKLKSLFGDELPPITLARDDRTGLPVELVARKDADAAIKKVLKELGEGPAPSGLSAAEKREREKERLQAEVRRRVMTELVAKMEASTTLSQELLEVLVLGAIESTWNETHRRVADRRGLPTDAEDGAKKGSKRKLPRLAQSDRLRLAVPTLSYDQLRGLLLELLVSRGAPGKWSDADESYTRACEVLGVDLKAIEAEVVAEAKAKPSKRSPPTDGKKPSKKAGSAGSSASLRGARDK